MALPRVLARIRMFHVEPNASGATLIDGVMNERTNEPRSCL